MDELGSVGLSLEDELGLSGLRVISRYLVVE